MLRWMSCPGGWRIIPYNGTNGVQRGQPQPVATDMKPLLILLLVLGSSCNQKGTPACTANRTLHHFGNWVKVENGSYMDHYIMQERACDNCGWIDQSLTKARHYKAK